MKTKLKRDDNVQIVSGKDRGKSGKVLRIDSVKGRVIVQGLNMVRKAVKPKRQNDKGGIIDVEAALDISNVMIICKKCGPSRVGYSLDKNGKKRVCRKCGEAL
ncbi:MAG: 50S ribosomal protein L24 [Spirochaetales bacterium]|jgi:large subunit ribosomal protein L24|nr:50S ribosomal protein L24 [Spirochaetales bacterium]